MRRLVTIPGVGVIIAASIKALVPDPHGFKSGRHFAAWLGLTPRSHSSGGKERLGRISKMGNSTLRSLLIIDATAVLKHVRHKADAPKWLVAILARRPFKVVATALANNLSLRASSAASSTTDQTRSLADFITTTSGLRFSVHTKNF
jgi:transposase